MLFRHSGRAASAKTPSGRSSSGRSGSERDERSAHGRGRGRAFSGREDDDEEDDDEDEDDEDDEDEDEDSDDEDSDEDEDDEDDEDEDEDEDEDSDDEDSDDDPEPPRRNSSKRLKNPETPGGRQLAKVARLLKEHEIDGKLGKWFAIAAGDEHALVLRQTPKLWHAFGVRYGKQHAAARSAADLMEGGSGLRMDEREAKRFRKLVLDAPRELTREFGALAWTALDESSAQREERQANRTRNKRRTKRSGTSKKSRR